MQLYPRMLNFISEWISPIMLCFAAEGIQTAVDADVHGNHMQHSAANVRGSNAASRQQKPDLGFCR